MLIFGTSVTDPGMYDRCAGPGVRRAVEPDSLIWANAAAGSIFRSYNLMLDRAADYDDLEALVLLHQDAEIVDDDFSTKLRAAMQSTDVGVVGCVGAIDVRSIAWWEGSVTIASFVHRYSEFGGGDITGFSFESGKEPPYSRTGEVDTVDGFVLCLSPWVVRNVRFDETLGVLHGYDFDFCLQVRAAGRRVVTSDFKVIHHHSLELVNDPETWIQAHVRVAEKWGREGSSIGEPNLGVAGGDWQRRARFAEAEAAAARLELQSVKMQLEALDRLAQRRVTEMSDSVSWRVTAPLRSLNARRRTVARSMARNDQNGDGQGAGMMRPEAAAAESQTKALWANGNAGVARRVARTLRRRSNSGGP